MRPGIAGAALIALSLAACATAPPSRPQPGSPRPAPLRHAPRPTGERAAALPEPSAASVLPLSALKGWTAEDHAAALAAFRETCGVSRDPSFDATSEYVASGRSSR